ncbi:MAG: hypothetical protein HBSAPP02_07030 [Phycisphaerae bacterium]|nr:MAG: hypothetical protein HBSAPP02_07030 [Phycisphaerae bacterium]
MQVRIHERGQHQSAFRIEDASASTGATGGADRADVSDIVKCQIEQAAAAAQLGVGDSGQPSGGACHRPAPASMRFLYHDTIVAAPETDR